MNFDSDCRQCPRLATFLGQVKSEYPDYHARPVAPFGDPNARFLVVGLAPGMHGANATGRPFTGDYAGILLYHTLYQYGFSDRPESVSATDGLRLLDCRITNAVKCLPPANKPVAAEVNQCNGYLRDELSHLPPDAVVLALGSIAHQAVIQARDLPKRAYPFGHGREHRLTGELTLIDSYHCSRYNTQTKRLTEEMFQAVFDQVKRRLA